MAADKNLAVDPYEKLAAAIVRQAATDYRVALRKIKAHPKNRDAMDAALRIEGFFRSGWYSELTSVDGEYLIRKLREEVRQSESIRGKQIFRSEVDHEQTSAGS